MVNYFRDFPEFFFWIEGWVGGVYRIQTCFGFLYFFYIYKAPKSVDIKINTAIAN